MTHSSMSSYAMSRAFSGIDDRLIPLLKQGNKFFQFTCQRLPSGASRNKVYFLSGDVFRHITPTQSLLKYSYIIMIFLLSLCKQKIKYKKSVSFKAKFAVVGTFFINRFPSLKIFVSKKVGNREKQDHFYYISYNRGGLSFFQIPTFSSTKVLREGNLFM